MLKIFTIKFESSIESFNDSILSNFLSDKTVVRWESHFFTNKNECYWTVLVEYKSLSAPSATLFQKEEKKRDEEYKKILTGNDWPLFKRLREWRNEKGKAQGVPPYIILTNVQLAHISVTRPQSLNALQEIQGIGNAKKQKYGNEIINIIKSFGLPVQENKVEEHNGQ
jgi:superfamily II DNA helicase RecQ